MRRSYSSIKLTYKLPEVRTGGQAERDVGAHHTVSSGVRIPPCWRPLRASRGAVPQKETRLINVSAELRLYRYSNRMAPFISTPSARARLWLPRQPTRTEGVCSSPARGVFTSQGC